MEKKSAQKTGKKNIWWEKVRKTEKIETIGQLERSWECLLMMREKMLDGFREIGTIQPILGGSEQPSLPGLGKAMEAVFIGPDDPGGRGSQI